MLFKRISAVLLLATTTVLGCEMDCRRGVSKNFADFYSPVIKTLITDLQSQVIVSIDKVAVPEVINNEIDKSELTDEIEQNIETTLHSFYSMATSETRLAEGFYQVLFNEELPYKGDCNNPRRLTRKMPPLGESWTLEECEKMDYRCGNPPSICYFLQEVKGRCIGRMQRQLTEYASVDNGALVRGLVRSIRKSVFDTLSNNGVGKLSENNQVEAYIARLVSATIRVLDLWVADDVRELCSKPSQHALCNSWDDQIKKEILRWP